APVQVQVIPVSPEHHFDYAQEVTEALKKKGIRVELDAREEKVGYKIREAQVQKIPYMLVVGEKEIQTKTVNVRKYGEKDSESVPFQEFLERIVAESRV